MRNLILGISVIALTGCSTGEIKALATVFTGHNFMSVSIPSQDYNVTKVSSSNGTCQTWIPAILQDYTQTKITNVTWTGGCDQELYKGGELEGYGTLSGFDKNKQLVFQLKGFARSYGSTNIFTSFEFDFLGVKIKYRDKYISKITFSPGGKIDTNGHTIPTDFKIVDAIEYKAQQQVYIGNYIGSISPPKQPKQLNKNGTLDEKTRQIYRDSGQKIDEIYTKAAQQKKKTEEEEKAYRQQQRQQLGAAIGTVVGAAATMYTQDQMEKVNTKQTTTPTYTLKAPTYTQPVPTQSNQQSQIPASRQIPAVTNCVNPQNGVLYNNCSFPVQVAYCIINPRENRDSNGKTIYAMNALGVNIDCEKDQQVFDVISANGKTRGIFFGEKVMYIACRTNNQIGLKAEYNPSTRMLEGYCH